MELVYLWVEKYKNIEKQGFNFSPKFECKYDGKTLTIEDKPNHLDKFFGENINITAIVGENGSGKSSILELISYFSLDRSFQGLKSSVLVVVEVKGKFFIDTIKLQNKPHVSNETNLKIKNSARGFISKEFFLISFHSKLQKPKFIESKYEPYNGYNFFKYIKSEELEFSAKFAFLLNWDKKLFSFMEKRVMFSKIGFELSLDQKLSSENFPSINSKNLDKVLNIIDDNFRFFTNPFRKGQQHQILTEENKKFLIENFVISILLSYYLDAIEKDISEVELRDLDEEAKKSLILNIKDKYINNTFSKINIHTTDNFEDKKNFVHKIREVVSDILGKFIEEKQGTFRQGIHINQDFLIPHKKALKYIKHIDIIINIIYKNFELSKKEKLKLEQIRDLDTSYITRFYRAYTKSLIINKLIDNNTLFVDFYNNSNKQYTFMDLSTGEKEILRFFTKFGYTLVKSNKINNSNSNKDNNFTIFLDEIDSGFHPNWQKNLLALTLDFIAKLKDIKAIDRDKKIHLIFLTHSPFILSDLPKENVIFLKDGKQVDGVDMKQTFGANIHELLSHGFFMDHTMGEFAKSRIQEILDFFNNDKELQTIQENQIKPIIESIGESFLREKLLSMYYAKFKDEETKRLKKEELEKEKERIEKELEDLEND